MKIQIAVSSMTNCESFLEDGAEAALQKLSALQVKSVEISQHIFFDETTIPAFLQAKEQLDIGVCAISVRFDGTECNPMPALYHNGKELRAFSCEAEFDHIVSLCRQFGCRYVRYAGFPGNLLHTEAAVRAYMASLEEMCARFAAEGITLCVHNHADEFMRVAGRLLIDWAAELCPHLQFELDVMNAQKCGADPKEFLAAHAGRVPLLHVQDIQVCPGEGADAWLKPEYRGVPVGSGNLNYRAICRAAEQAGSEYLIIEQARFYGEDVYACIAKAVSALQQYTAE